MAYTKKFQQLGEAARARIEGVTVDELERLAASGAIILDIRDKEEFDAGTLPGAVHVSRGKLEMDVESVVPDLETTIVCFCNAHHRGSLSADTLRQMGYRHAHVLVGGLNAYKARTTPSADS